MKKANKNITFNWTMVMGVVTALIVVFSQLFFFQDGNNFNKKDLKTGETQQEQRSDNSNITLPSISQQQSSATVEANQKSFCLFEIIFGETEEDNSTQETPLLFGKFFQMLFKVIITPNAP